MSSAEESAIHYGLINPKQLALQGGSLTPDQHQQLQHYLIQQSPPQLQDGPGAQPSHQDALLRSLIARLDSLQEQNQQLQSQLQTASSASSLLTHTSSASPSVTIDWNKGLKFLTLAPIALPEDMLTKDEYAWLCDFELFKKKLLVTFGDPDKAAADARHLNLLCQTGAVSLYAAEFHITSSTGSRKSSRTNSPTSTRSTHSTPWGLIEQVVILDNRAFMRRLQRNNWSYTLTLSSVPTTRSFSSPSPASVPVVAPEDRMQLDANRRSIKRGPLPTTQAEKDYHRRNNLCTRDRKPRPAFRTAATTATFQISPAPMEDDPTTVAEDSGNDQCPTSEEQ
ncbi:hypothetical protein JCM1840_007635 [Sporobolomyces johnsonii]